MHIRFLPPVDSMAQRVLPWWTWPYKQIGTDSLDEKRPTSSHAEGEEEQQQAIAPQQWFTWTFRKTAICATAAIIATGVLAALGMRFGARPTKINTQSQSPVRLCGNSSADALSLGCTFDQLLWAWLPPSCPHYANDEFLAAEEWKYYIDPFGEEPAVGDNWEKALDNQKDLWGERREHLTHCVYVFLSLGQIIRDGTSYPPRLVAYEHLHHCANIILESLRQDKNWNVMETSVGRVSYEEYC
ncbi:hypothetical protein CDEST_08017 [Colletotrichum destructivum]|uniref:Tat pathway signal sequence n=1 Tax=Colletotrichum destructivum TaxID=34406 RepID=A0AAX4IJT8_9PEZI|nr:hypothetical protein CDEST_08017 [Colletotrichum destructivum]